MMFTIPVILIVFGCLYSAHGASRLQFFNLNDAKGMGFFMVGAVAAILGVYILHNLLCH